MRGLRLTSLAGSRGWSEGRDGREERLPPERRLRVSAATARVTIGDSDGRANTEWRRAPGAFSVIPQKGSRQLDAQMVSFPGGGRNLDGYLALPDADGPHPAIIVIHEIWGLDEHIKDVARRFAEQGYVALAPDLYTGEWRDAMRPENITAGMMFLRQAPADVQRDPAKMMETLSTRSPEEQKALKTLMQIMSPEQRGTFAAELGGAVQYLRERGEVSAEQVASLGFCMGGGLAIRVATLVPELWKTVIFYGDNPPLEQVPAIQARVFGIYGGQDRRITDSVPDFQRAMEAASKPFTYKVYGGAQHAFFNDTRPMYSPDAAADAWREVLSFLSV